MDCIFCKIVAGEIPAHKVYEDDQSLAFLDILPATRGHTLVIPKQHAATIEDISPDSLTTTTRAAQTVAGILRDRLHPDGMNVTQNNGVAAGQEVFHYHLHLLPRWTGDRVSLGHRGATDHTALAALAGELRAAE
jgi:histidine triad (HIT) family protein